MFATSLRFKLYRNNFLETCIAVNIVSQIKQILQWQFFIINPVVVYLKL